jgi:hypothetical protein
MEQFFFYFFRLRFAFNSMTQTSQSSYPKTVRINDENGVLFEDRLVGKFFQHVWCACVESRSLTSDWRPYVDHWHVLSMLKVMKKLFPGKKTNR